MFQKLNFYALQKPRLQAHTYFCYVPVKGFVRRYEDGQTVRAALTKTEDGNKEDYS
jgi:hypothetical protein